MDRIEIELGMWESAPCPIYTGKITDEKLEWAEHELYEIAVAITRNKQMVDDLLNGKGELVEDQYKRGKFIERLCDEEENLVIEIGGIYYEDMVQDTTCPYCNGDLIIESKNGLSKCLECGNEF